MLCCCGDTISVRQDIHEGAWWSSRCTPEREWSIEPFSGNMLEYFTILLTKKVVLWSEYCCFYIRPSPYDGMRKIIPRAREMHCYYLYYSSIVAKKEKFINFLTIIQLLHVPVLGKGSSYDLTDKQKKYLNRHLVTIVRCCCRWLFACSTSRSNIYQLGEDSVPTASQTSRSGPRRRWGHSVIRPNGTYCRMVGYMFSEGDRYPGPGLRQQRISPIIV